MDKGQAHMPRKVTKGTNFASWAAALELSAEEVKAAWQELHRRGLVSTGRGQVTVSPLAMRRATSEGQRRLAAHLSGYMLTDNSFIVRRAGDPPGLPCILNTRITVEQIANYFREGWGVTAIERDLSLLTRDEIEAAIHYYLNHRAEIELDRQRSREIYEAHVPKQETLRA
jgi:uncharacterized protein (DUF433 family)